MTRALFQKEWIKIRWMILLVGIATVGVIIELFFNIRSAFVSNDGIRIILSYTDKQALFYGNFRYFSAVFGVLIALYQFFPEARKGRIRLALHLPVTADKLLTITLSIGLGLVLVYNLFVACMLALISAPFYPVEVIQSMLITILPWLLAGFPAYLVTSLVVLEPQWLRKVVYMLTGYFFIRLFWETMGYNSQIYIIGWYAGLSVLFLFTLYLTIFRIKRGAIR